VIYTSGSTGRPKGVMVSQQAIANRLLWMQRELPLWADDTVLQKTPYGFDASIWEIFSPLSAGARFVLAEPGGHQDAAYLLDAVARHQVTVLQLVPSMLAVFLEQGEVATGCRSLRRVFCGGEAFPAELAARCSERTGARVCNLYGPTETAIDATFHLWEPGAVRSGLVPIGRPLDNLCVYLLDPAGHPVPPGLAGELYVGGSSLARGYLSRPELTAERFVPAPWSFRPGERLYRTGDLARHLPGGLDFLGRVDQQVKVRGFRIEPGEIEWLLTGHPEVEEAVVGVLTDGSGGPRLVAWLKPRHELAPTAGELAAHLGARLPAFMVPAAFVPMPELPRLPNGKLDRRALPAPGREQTRGAAAFVGPRTPTEEALAAIWAELLGIERVGVHDNFFELGGNSLMAIQVMSRLRSTFDAQLKVRELFAHPSLEALALRTEEAVMEAAGAADLERLLELLEGDEEVDEEELRRSLSLGSR
jgi:acyl-coenzyme A synthetase/AMP-(fatty) acid ligase/acyl carrier protein